MMTSWDRFLGYRQEEGVERGGGGPKNVKWDVLVLINVVSLFLYRQSSNLNQSRMGFFSYHMSMKRADIWFLTNNSQLVHSCLFHQEESQRWRNNEEKKVWQTQGRENKTKKTQRWIIEWSWKICQSQFSRCHILFSNLVTGPSSWAGSDQMEKKKKKERGHTDTRRDRETKRETERRKVGVENKSSVSISN